MIYNYLSFLCFVSSDQDSQGKKNAMGIMCLKYLIILYLFNCT